MPAQADDTFVVVTASDRIFVHRCTRPMTTVVAFYVRSELDPMALGTCRHCGEVLPSPGNAPGEASDRRDH